MTENTQQLESILNEFIKGHLTLAAYRQKRGRYIREFMEHSEKDNTQRMAPINRRSITSLQAESQPLSIPKVIDKQSNTFGLLMKLLLIVIISGATFAAWYFSPQLDNKPETAASEPQTPLSSTADEEDENLEQTVGLFVFKFLTKDQWDTNALSDFLVQWQALPRKQQNALRKTPSFIQLRDTLRKRINEQRALKSADTDSQAKQQENLLIWFSTQLSISI